MAWYLAPALDTLRDEINRRWPNRDRTSDGTIGDAAHSSRVSDHNPDPTSDPPDIVRAFDIDEDGIDTALVIRRLLADIRTRYVIYEARIWQRVTGRWDPYTGPNLHRYHIHVSVRDVDRYAYDRSPWGIATTTEGDNPMDALTADEQRWMLAALKNLDRALVPRDPKTLFVGHLDEFQAIWRATFNNARDALAEVRALEGQAPTASTLTDADVDRIAGRVADLLRARLES